RPSASLHREPDAVKHEPAGFLCDTERPRQLVGADAVLAVGEHPQRGQPLVEPDGAILEDRPELHRELPPTLAALPDAAGLEEAGDPPLARGTGRRLWAAECSEEGQAGVGGREVAGSLTQRAAAVVELGDASIVIQ